MEVANTPAEPQTGTNLLDPAGMPPETPATPAGQPQEWLNAFPEDIRNSPDYADTFKSIGEKYKNDSGQIMKGLLNAYKAVGKAQEGMIKIPGEQATEDEKKAFSDTLRKFYGAPETPDKYEGAVKVKGDDGAEVELQLDPVTDKTIREFLHSAGLGNQHYQAAIDAIYKMNQEAITEAHGALQDEWGRNFLPRLNMVKREIQRIPDEVFRSELVQKYGNDPLVAKLVYHFVQGRKEDTIPDDPGFQTNLTAGDVEVKMRELQNEMLKEQDKTSAHYAELNKKYDQLLEYQMKMSLQG